MNKNRTYQEPMKPWPDLQGYGKSVKIYDGNLTLFYYEAGEINPLTLMMIHGLGDEADTWRHIFNPLAEDYHVIAMDLPGFGRSDLPDNKITPVFLLNCLLELLNVLELETAIMVGNSLGGILAHAISLKNPERVDGLVLVDGSFLQIEPMGDISLRLMQIPLLGEWLYKRLRKNPQAAFDSLRNVYHDLDRMPEADRKFLFTRVNKRVWSNKQRQAYFSTLRNLTPWIKSNQVDLSDQLEELKIPTLVMRGEYDELFPEVNAKGVVKVQPQAIFSEIKDAGHLPHQEAPAEFLRDLRQWLQQTFD